ncbi:DUF72 domain-containing protein [Microvirga sp. 2MCAF38]|uniref:DUF72 domain-containing protein n=1 Tax=Microvirga sp. 2MCAF38 TaxID=3232989 RepID=UPI003F98C617
MSKPRGSSASKSSSSARSKTAELRIGTSGWHYSDWRGPFYPADLTPKNFLSFYVEHFNTTEINNSFYRIPTEKAVETWRDSAPEGFLFAWKASRIITHLKRLKDVGDNVDFVFKRMDGLGPAFGPVLFQLPPTLSAKPEYLERLARCLGQIPRGRRCTVEFRHASWFEKRPLDILREHNAALCLSDHVAAPAPWIVTADFIYVRGHGKGGHYTGRYSRETLHDWARSIDTWRSEGRDVFVYFDNDVKSAAPHDANELMALLAKATG